MVERSLSMREVPGSIPGASIPFCVSLHVCLFFYLFNNFGLQSKICAFKEASQPYEILKQKVASSGNRTRAARVAGEHSTTEPTMLTLSCEISINEINSYNQKRSRKYETHKWKSVDQNKISVTKAWCCQKFFTQSVGFEPTLPEGIWFLVRRLNHSATTAHGKAVFPPRTIVTPVGKIFRSITIISSLHLNKPG